MSLTFLCLATLSSQFGFAQNASGNVSGNATNSESPSRTIEPSKRTVRLNSEHVKARTTEAQENARPGLDPYPSDGQYVAFSISLNTEAILSAGALCPDEARERCILEGGGGLSLGAMHRSPMLSIGAFYQVTFHGSNNIYQRGVLQQLRSEFRYRPKIMSFANIVSGFVGGGLGLASYGDNWAIDTLGAAANLSLGAEIELNVKLALVLAFSYRSVLLTSFTDGTGEKRPTGLAHTFGVQLGFELRDPL